MMNIPQIILQINDDIKKCNGKLYIVGGYIRDHLLNISTNDIDLEVFKIDSNKLTDILSKYGKVHIYETFGVHCLIIDEITYEFTICRTESKIGTKHTDFKIDVNPNLTIKEASLRRDFTVNSLYYDIDENEIIDLYNGINDINNKVLKHVNDLSFKEDPLRILRALRFSTNYDFKIDDRTLNYILEIIDELKYISKERKSVEFNKIITGKYFINQIEYIRIILFRYFSLLIDENYKLNNINKYYQNLKYHPEGDVWTHTILTLKVYEKVKTCEYDDFIVKTSLLLHDIGKVKDTYEINGSIKNTNHELTSFKFTEQFINEFIINKNQRKLILNLIKDHMIPFRLYNMSSNTLYDYLNKYQDNIKYLCMISLCDKCGRRDEKYFNEKYDDIYNNMYVYWLNIYKHFNNLKKKFDGHYYLSQNINNEEIKIRQKYDIVRELEKIRYE